MFYCLEKSFGTATCPIVFLILSFPVDCGFDELRITEICSPTMLFGSVIGKQCNFHIRTRLYHPCWLICWFMLARRFHYIYIYIFIYNFIYIYMEDFQPNPNEVSVLWPLLPSLSTKSTAKPQRCHQCSCRAVSANCGRDIMDIMALQ